MEDFPHTVSQHRGPRPDLRSHNGRDVRTGGFPLDRVRHDIRRSRPRLSLGHDVAAQRRCLAARDCRRAAGRWRQERDARLLAAADDPCRRGVRLQSRRPARNADAEQPRPDVLDCRDLRLLHAGHPAADRQAHRQAIPRFRTRASLHGRRHHDDALCQLRVGARDVA